MTNIPTSLRIWFKIHFFADMIFGIPFIFAPTWTMSLFRISIIDTLAVRIVGAALIGIGGISLIANKKGIESYQTLLSLKVVWSIAALIAILLYLFNGGVQTAWLFFGVFLIFSIVWGYYKNRLGKS